MKTKFLRPHFPGILFLWTIALTVHAQSTVVWQAPHTISGAADVATNGTTFGTWAPYSTAAQNGLTVNGVTFLANSGLALLDFNNLDGGGTVFVSPNTANANYNTLLQSAAWGNTGPGTITWGGMTIGKAYEIQFWVNDGRSTAPGRTESVSGGSGTSARLSFGYPGPGQYVIGTFVAASTSETITLDALTTPQTQINLLQVRGVTLAPEPSSLAFFAAGISAWLCFHRRVG